MTEPSFYIWRHEEYWGPYARADLDDFFREQLLAADDRIWDAATQDWKRYREIVDAGEPDARADALDHGCSAHPATPAVAICSDCDALLCPSCVRMVGDRFYCLDCHWAARRKSAIRPAGLAGSLGRLVSEQPLAGPLLILLLVFGLKFTLGERRWEKIEGIAKGRTTGYFYQSLRTAGRGFTLPENHPAVADCFARSGRALDRIIEDENVAPDVKASCIAMKIQLLLFRDTSAGLQPLLAEYASHAGRDPADPLGRFFRACGMHFIEGRHTAAAEELDRLAYYDDIPISETESLPLEAWVFAVDKEEMLYFLGCCRAAEGKSGEARRLWKRIGQHELWKELAARRLESE